MIPTSRLTTCSALLLATACVAQAASRPARPPHTERPQDAAMKAVTANFEEAGSEASRGPNTGDPLVDAASGDGAAPSPLGDGGTPMLRLGAYANTDPRDDAIVGPPAARKHCAEDLAAAGISYRETSIPVHTPPTSKIQCGAPELLFYLSGPGNIHYEGTPLLTCGMALALASFERVLQAEAQRIFASPVVRINQIGTYNCRVMTAFPRKVSEHSYANAMDMMTFTLQNGTTIDVQRDFEFGEFTKTPAGTFLRTVSQRANDEDVFSHVLTPFFDAAHHNHFHLDLARYRQDGTRPQSHDGGAP